MKYVRSDLKQKRSFKKLNVMYITINSHANMRRPYNALTD